MSCRSQNVRLRSFNFWFLCRTFLLLLSPRPEVNAQVVGGERGIWVDPFELACPQRVKRDLVAFFKLGILDGKSSLPRINDFLDHPLVPLERLFTLFRRLGNV